MSKVLENRIEKIKVAIEKGYTGNIQTGEVYDWKGKLVTRKTNYGYVQIAFRNNDKVINLKAHQFIWYLATGEVVECIDHINGIKSDNIISNLRSVTSQENTFNRIKAKGVCWHKLVNKWQAQIKIDGKSIHLGYFIHEQDARQAYLDAKIKYHTIKT